MKKVRLGTQHGMKNLQFSDENFLFFPHVVRHFLMCSTSVTQCLYTGVLQLVANSSGIPQRAFHVLQASLEDTGMLQGLVKCVWHGLLYKLTL